MPPDNFFPSNVRIPKYFQDRSSKEASLTPPIIPIDNEDKDDNDSSNDKPKDKSMIDQLLSLDIDETIRKNDRILLLILAFVLYKEKADWSTIAALLYLAL